MHHHNYHSSRKKEITSITFVVLTVVILTNQKQKCGYVFRKEQKLLYRCHNCSKGTTLQGLLKHIDVNIYKDYIFEQFKKDRVNKELDGKLTFTQPNFMKGSSPLKSLKKISQLRHDHPVKRFVDSRKIPTKTHYELFFAPKFYKWVNTIIPNKFPSTEGDHPRLVIPFFDENNKFFAFKEDLSEMKILNILPLNLIQIRIKSMDSIESINQNTYWWSKAR